MTTDFDHSPGISPQTSTYWQQILFIDPGATGSTFRQRVIGWADAATLVCLAGLAALLPFADITAAREVCLWGGLFFWLVRLAASGQWKFIRTPLELPWLIFIGVATLSLLTAVDPVYTRHEIGHELLKGVLIYYLAVNNLRTAARAMVCVWALMAGVVVMDFYGLVDHLTHDPKIRLIGLQATSPQLWTYLIQTAPFLIIVNLWLTKPWHRVSGAGLLLIHILATYWTGGRTPMVVLLLQTAMIIFFLGIRLRYIVSGVVILGLGLALFLPRQAIVIGDQSPTELNVGGVTVKGLKGTRLEVWAQVLKHLEAHPFAGLGYGRRSFNKQYPELVKVDYHLWHPHNLLLGIAVETGLQGLVAFLFLVFCLIKTLWPRFPRGPDWLKSGPVAGFIVAACAMVIGSILNDMTDYHLVDEAALMFWLLAGGAISLLDGGIRKSTRPADS